MTARGQALWLGVAFGAASIAALPAAEPAVADGVFQRLDEERRASGAPDWERRADLDRVATQAAEEVAASDRRWLARPIEGILEDVGVRGVHRAIPAVQVLRGYDDPVEVAIHHWSSYQQIWSEVINPDIDAIGMGEARSSDGSGVLVGVLVTYVVPFDLVALELDVAQAIDEQRADHDLAPLLLMIELSDVARSHSTDMATRDYFDHRSPEGASVASRMLAGSVVFDSVAENISKVEGSDDPAAIAVQGWMSSPGHRANILSTEYSESGIGIAIDERGALYFTQVFTRGARLPRNKSK